MTEDEAKGRICCNSSAGIWRDEGQTEAGSYCRGSACMAWRWTSGFPLPDDPPAINERYQGYCGLAGRP